MYDDCSRAAEFAFYGAALPVWNCRCSGWWRPGRENEFSTPYLINVAHVPGMETVSVYLGYRARNRLNYKATATAGRSPLLNSRSVVVELLSHRHLGKCLCTFSCDNSGGLAGLEFSEKLNIAVFALVECILRIDCSLCNSPQNKIFLIFHFTETLYKIIFFNIIKFTRKK